jgi:hypothetical protein
VSDPAYGSARPDHASLFPGLAQKLAQDLTVPLLLGALPGRLTLWISDGDFF